MLWVAAGLTLVTGWDYLTTGLRHATGPRPSAPVATPAANPVNVNPVPPQR
jgi:cardiolipin synthase